MAIDVRIRTTLDGVGEVKGGFDKIGKSTKSLSGKIELLNARLEKLSQSFTAAGRSLVIGLTLPLVAASGALFKFASDAEESENLFQVAMGDMADSARTFSERLRDELGLNDFEVRKFTATIFQMTTSMGLSREVALEMSTGITSLTFDLASLRNIGIEEAFNKLRSAITGEIEPLRALGIDISEASVKMALLGEGIDVTSGKLTVQQKILGRYLAILNQTTSDQGDLTRTLGSVTNQFRLFTSGAKLAAIELGNQLLPVASVLLNVAGEIGNAFLDGIRAFKEFTPEVKGMMLAFAGLLIAIGPVLLIVGKLLAAFKVLAAGMLAMVSIPGLIVVGLVALVAAGTALALSWDELEAKTKAVWANIQASVAEAVFNILESMRGPVAEFLGFEGAIESMQSTVRGFLMDLPADVDFNTGAIGQSFDDLMAEIGQSMKKRGDEILAFFAAPFQEFEGVIEDIDISAFILEFSDEMRKAFEEGSASSIAALKKIATAAKKLADEQKKLRLDTLNFDIEIGKKQLEDRRSLLFEELSAAKDMSQETVKDRLDRARAILEIEMDIADTIEEIAEREIERIENITDITQEEALKQLAIELEKFRAMGDAGALAAKRIEEAMRGSTAAIEKTATATIDAAGEMSSAFDQFFQGVISGSLDMQLILLGVLRSIGGSITSTFSKKFGEAVFGSATDDGGGGGSGAVGLGSIFTGVPGLDVGGAITEGQDDTVLSGNLGFLAPEAEELKDNVGAFNEALAGVFEDGTEVTGEIFGLLTDSLSKIFDKVKDVMADLFSALIKALADIFSQLGGGFADFLGIAFAVASGNPIAIASTFGTAGGGPGQFGSSGFARHGSIVVTRPTLFSAGEAGAERVSVTGLGERSGGGGLQVIMQGPLVTDEVTMARFERRLLRALDQRAGRRI